MSNTTPSPLEAPNPPLSRVTQTLRRIYPWLQSQRGRGPSHAALGQWMNIPEGTA